MFRKPLFLFLIFFPSFATASELPFTDVSSEDFYYSDLKHMYDAGVIGDTVDHLFRPDGLLPRDEFVGIAVGVSCQNCLSPSIEDIIRYRTDPFIDILKTNRYFYCISYAQEKEIVRGYTLDATGKTQCQNGQTFEKVPFCGENNITRIEAAAVLLRQSGLWNESFNENSYEKKAILQDVDDYWYGYAQKAVESGLIRIDTNGKIFPNEYITRKEFVTMASRIFTINMCSVKNIDETPADFASIIQVFDKEKNNCSDFEGITIFPNSTETVYDFGGYVTGNLALPLQYDWTFTNRTTGEQKFATGSCLDNFDLGSGGDWVLKLVVTDSVWWTSTSSVQVFSQGAEDTNEDNGISLQIGDPNNILKTSFTALRGSINDPLQFFSTTAGWDGKYTYSWGFWDGWKDSTENPSHIFANDGVYTITLTVQDSSGNTAYSQSTVVIDSNPDRDGDGVFDYDSEWTVSDICPEVFGPISNSGCPKVNEYHPENDTGNINDNGGPDNGSGDTGNDRGATGNTDTSINNLCLSDKIQKSGMIQWSVSCSSCPCEYSAEFIAKVRECDILFPSIVSPDKKTLYSRGSIFPIP